MQDPSQDRPKVASVVVPEAKRVNLAQAWLAVARAPFVYVQQVSAEAGLKNVVML